MKELKLKTSDQFPLAVKLFEAKNPNGKLLLINAATGVKQQVYFSFARYLSEEGFTVLTYDYRGINESKPEHLKGFKASMRIWGTEDFKTLTDFIQDQYPNFNKYVLGHSVGALILGMNPGSAIFKKFIFIATQDAYIGNLNWKVAITALLGFGIALPLTTNLMGYFPANYFGLGASLPKGVAFDWQTLILNRKSTQRLFDKNKFDFSKQLNQETFIIHAEDDSWVTKKGMESLMNNAYPNLKKRYCELLASESPKGEIGHVNFFRTYNKPLWKVVLDELN